MVAPLRIVFFGTPAFAVPTLEALVASPHAVVGVVTQPDKPRGRGRKISESPVKATAVAAAIPTIQPERLRDAVVIETLHDWRPDLGVVAAYGKIIPEPVLQLPRHGIINVHASLLPKYRGAAPIHRAVIEGESETGITIMRVEKTLDSGAMFAKVRRPIGPDETSDAIESDLARLGASLLVDVVDQIAAGTAREEAQDAEHSSYAPKITKEDGQIDWNLPALAVHNRVRGLFPWPHAYTYLDGSRFIIRKTRVEDTATDAVPGTIVALTRDAIQVAAGHGECIAIECVQTEGGRPLNARDFLAGHPLRIGTRFSSQ